MESWYFPGCKITGLSFGLLSLVCLYFVFIDLSISNLKWHNFRKLNRDTPLRTLAGLTGSWCQKVRDRLIDLISSGIEPRVVVGPMDLQT